MTREILRRLQTWEGLLLVILIVVIVYNAAAVPGYLGIQNQINLFELSVEKAIVVLSMTFVIVSAEIDLSVASVMGLAAVLVAWLPGVGVPFEAGILIALVIGAVCGLFNGYWIAIVGLPSLAVTLATLIGFRGLARLLIEDRSVGGFPEWFNSLGQQPILGPFPLAIIIFAVLVAVSVIVLGHSGFGRYVYVIGSSSRVATFSGVRVERIRLVIFTMSGLVAALAGILLAARLGAVRGSTAEGFELDIITMVLLGGVSIFGGKGSMTGVILSILLILNLRNGLGLANVTGNTQTGVVGLLLILSVLVPNLVSMARRRFRRAAAAGPAAGSAAGPAAGSVAGPT
jgi:rhamnose transport system permease protein